LTEIVLRQGTSNRLTVGDVVALIFGGRALGEDAGFGQQRLEVVVEEMSSMPSSARTLATAPSSMSYSACAG